jgi:hypothetical protein
VSSRSGLEAQSKKKIKSQIKNDPMWHENRVHGKKFKSGPSDPSGGRDLNS